MQFRIIMLGLLLVILVSPIGSAQNRTADQLSMAEKVELGVSYHTHYAEKVKPFTVFGNLHSVGAKNIGVYLITTEAGHILIDTGVREMHELILDNIKTLGFEAKDVKLLLATHAHFDHVQGHEAMRKATNAQVLAVGLDAEALRLGQDISPLGFEGWEPVQQVTTIKHGDTVTLGNVQLTAHQIPGHTQGCTVWTVPITENEVTLNVAIFGCRGPNANVKIQGNSAFPDLVEMTNLGFERLRQIQPDIYVSNHPQTDNDQFGDAMIAGARPQPLLQQTPWLALIAQLEKGFRGRLR